MKRILFFFLVTAALLRAQDTLKFSGFTPETSPQSTDYLAGYRSAGVAGGNRRYSLSTLNIWFGTNITITKGQAGLSLVDNTSDANKPVSTAQQTALDLKANLTQVIRYDASESLTSAQQAQARVNLGLVGDFEYYGAKGDGTTDDSAALNAALTANAGGTVKGKAGSTYLIGATVFYPANTTIDMTGATVKASASFSGYPIQAAGQKLAVLSPVMANPTTSTSGGTLAAATYAYGVSAVTGTGETMVAPTKTITTTGSSSTATITWTAPSVPSGASAITNYKIYGRTMGNISLLLGTVSSSTFTFTDTGGAGTSSSLPASNTTFGRTAGIRIIGGTYDCNGANRSCDFDWVTSGRYAGHCFDLQKVDDCLIRGVTVLNAKKWAIAVADFGVLKTENVILNTLSDGIHVLGPGLSWTDRGRHVITTGDDASGVSLAEWPAYAVSRGSIVAVDIADMYLETCPSAIRVLGAAGYALGLFRAKNITGNYSGQFRGGIYVWDQQPVNGWANGWANGTDILMVDVQDISLNMVNSPLIGSPYGSGRNPVIVLGGRNINAINIERITSVATSLPFGLIQFSRAAASDTIQTIDTCRIADCVWTCDTSDYPLLRVTDSTVMNRMKVSNTVLKSTASTGSMMDSRNSANIKNLSVDQCNYIGTAGSGQIVKAETGTITNLEVSNTVYAGCFRLCDVVSTGSVSRAVFRNNWAPSGVSAGELIRCNSTTAIDIVLDGNRLDSLSSNGAVNCGASTTVVVRSTGGNVFPSSKTAAFTSVTPTSVRVTGLDMPHDLAMTSAAKVAGDVANNTNSGLSCGVGPAITNGTTWKNIYSGSTF